MSKNIQLPTTFHLLITERDALLDLTDTLLAAITEMEGKLSKEEISLWKTKLGFLIDISAEDNKLMRAIARQNEKMRAKLN